MVEVGKSYDAEIIPMVFSDYDVKKSEEVNASILPYGAGYSYLVTGTLKGACIDCASLVLCDEALLEDFGFLDGQMVQWEIDRLDLSFC